MWFSKQGKKNYPFTLSKFKKKKMKFISYNIVYNSVR